MKASTPSSTNGGPCGADVDPPYPAVHNMANFKHQEECCESEKRKRSKRTFAQKVGAHL